MPDRAADYPEVFAHYGAEEVPERSIYPYSPVFPCRIAGRPAVLKRARRQPGGADAVAAVTRQWADHGVRVVTPLATAATNPVRLGEQTWIAYPYIAGHPYTGRDGELAAAGDLLGRAHAATGPAEFPPFEWPDHGPDSVAEDVAALREVAAPHVPAQVVERLEQLVTRFMAEVLPPLRDADLPVVNAVMDYKANNLIYHPDGPVLVDPDNGDLAPRLFDLAQAALLFHTEHEPAPPRLFDAAEWETFLRAYQRHVTLTAAEVARWPLAVDYILSEEGVWALTNAPQDWVPPRQRAFLGALAAADPVRFPVGTGGPDRTG